MSTPAVYRRRAELLLNLAKVAGDAPERQRLAMLAAEELDRAAAAERRASAPWRRVSADDSGAEA